MSKMLCECCKRDIPENNMYLKVLIKDYNNKKAEELMGFYFGSPKRKSINLCSPLCLVEIMSKYDTTVSYEVDYMANLKIEIILED